MILLTDVILDSLERDVEGRLHGAVGRDLSVEVAEGADDGLGERVLVDLGDVLGIEDILQPRDVGLHHAGELAAQLPAVRVRADND